MGLRIGIVTIQGAVDKHRRALERLGAEVSPVLRKEDLERLDGLVLPGGESTTISMGLERHGLFEPIQAFAAGGGRVLGTCAGAILLARESRNHPVRTLGLLDAVDRYPPTAIRLWYLRKHYRSPLEFSEEALEDAANTLDRLWSFRRRARDVFGEADDDALGRFRSAMEDDLNTAEALAVLFETVAEGNRRFDAGEDAASLVATYDEMVAILGLEEPAIHLGDIADELAGLAGRSGLEAEGDAGDIIEALIAAREQARRDQDFETSDAVRDGLAALGVVLEDTADGTRWHRR